MKPSDFPNMDEMRIDDTAHLNNVETDGDAAHTIAYLLASLRHERRRSARAEEIVSKAALGHGCVRAARRHLAHYEIGQHGQGPKETKR